MKYGGKSVVPTPEISIPHLSARFDGRVTTGSFHFIAHASITINAPHTGSLQQRGGRPCAKQQRCHLNKCGGHRSTRGCCSQDTASTSLNGGNPRHQHSSFESEPGCPHAEQNRNPGATPRGGQQKRGRCTQALLGNKGKRQKQALFFFDYVIRESNPGLSRGRGVFYHLHTPQALAPRVAWHLLPGMII